MTVTLPIHRALSIKLASRSFNAVPRWGYDPWVARVSLAFREDKDIKKAYPCSRARSIFPSTTRSYATKAASKPASRPKAHTGRTSATRSAKASTSKKSGPKTEAGKKKAGVKSKPSKAKVKASPKKKAVKKAPSITALRKEQRLKNKELKEKALLNPPKGLPATPWAIIFGEYQKGSTSFDRTGQKAQEAAQKLKNLTLEEKEHYNHLANQNKNANDAAYQQWLSTFTPEQVREANNARQQLRRQYKMKHPDKKTTAKFSNLKDDRQVKRARNAYVLFAKDRFASGDFAHMTIAESAILISKEWKTLDSTEKKKYEDEQSADHQRYIEEYTSVYGVPPPSKPARKPKA